MRITGLNMGQVSNIGNITDLLSKLNVGDVLKAQILEISANELLLKLFDGTTIAASAMSPIDVKKGDFVEFNVKGKTDSQIFIETVKTGEAETDNQNDIKIKLAAIDIKPDPKNIEIAKAIESNDIPVNKDIFEKVLNSINTFKDLSLQKAAFLNSSNIQVNQNNLKSLSYIVDGRMKIGQNLSDLMSLIEELEDPKMPDKKEVNLPNFNEKENNLYAGNEVKKENLKTDENTKAVSNKLSGEALLNDEAKSLSNALKETISKELKEFKQIKPEDLFKLIDRGLNDNGANSEIAKKIVDLIKSEISGSEGFDIKDKEQLDTVLKSLINKLDFKKEKNNPISMDETKDPVVIEKSKQSGILHKELEKIFVKLDSKNLEDDLNIKKIYKEIYEKLEAVKESVAGSSAANKDDVLNKVDNLQNNIKFLNEINNHSTYVQIPINMLNKNTSGEIYVLKRDSKRKRIDPANVTMYVSLDTNNIGKVDSLINLNKKNLSVNMRVEDKKVQDFIKDNHGELYKRLADIGYKLVDLKCRVISEDANILNINDIVKKEMAANKVSIDYKI